MNAFTDILLDVATVESSLNYCPALLAESDDSFCSKSITDYVSTPAESSHNDDVVRILSAAMQIASETGVISTPAASPLQTAFTAVDIAENLNVSYLVGRGEMVATVTADRIIDNAAAKAAVVAEVVLSPEGINMGMDAALDFITVAFPPAASAAQFAKQFTPYIAEKISPAAKSFVKQSIKNVSDIAHNVANKLIQKASEFIKDKATSVVKSLASLFR